jgi:hypothetical protein
MLPGPFQRDNTHYLNPCVPLSLAVTLLLARKSSKQTHPFPRNKTDRHCCRGRSGRDKDRKSGIYEDLDTRYRYSLLYDDVTEGKVKGQVEVTRRRGRRRKKLLDDLEDRRGYSHLKEKALDRIKWRNRFGRGFGPVV